MELLFIFPNISDLRELFYFKIITFIIIRMFKNLQLIECNLLIELTLLCTGILLN